MVLDLIVLVNLLILRVARNITIFGVDSSNSVHATNKTRSILILGHGITQKINNTTIYAEKYIHLILEQKIKHFV